MDEQSLLVQHLDEDGVASSIGRYKLKQKLSFAIIPLYILEQFVIFLDAFLVIITFNSDLKLRSGYVALKVIVVGVLIWHGADYVEGKADANVVVLVELGGGHVVGAIVDVD